MESTLNYNVANHTSHHTSVTYGITNYLKIKNISDHKKIYEPSTPIWHKDNDNSYKENANT